MHLMLIGYEKSVERLSRNRTFRLSYEIRIGFCINCSIKIDDHIIDLMSRCQLSVLQYMRANSMLGVQRTYLVYPYLNIYTPDTYDESRNGTHGSSDAFLIHFFPCSSSPEV